MAQAAGEMDGAGYSGSDINYIKTRVDFYLNLREEIRKASGETLDLKTYEADMRHLIDNFIQSDEPRKISHFEDQTLIDLIVKINVCIGTKPGGVEPVQGLSQIQSPFVCNFIRPVAPKANQIFKRRPEFNPERRFETPFFLPA